MSEGTEEITAILDRLENLEARICKLEKKPKEKPHGSEVFDAYQSAFFERYGVEPVRLAAVNNQCRALVGRVGLQDALDLIRFYLRQNDAWYSQKNHSVQYCLGDAESLVARMKGAKKTSAKEANKNEEAESSALAGANYLKNKYEKV